MSYLTLADLNRTRTHSAKIMVQDQQLTTGDF